MHAMKDSEHIILLNDDVIVTAGWVLDLTRHLRMDPKLGIVSPVTNKCGNEALVPLELVLNASQSVVLSRRAESVTFMTSRVCVVLAKCTSGLN
jgi:hypothetical protein